MLKYILFALLFISLFYRANAQNYNYRNFTTEDGLASNDIYDMVEEENGLLWMASEYGVSRFDGYNFKTYTIDNGLPSLSNLRLFLDEKKKLWVAGNDGSLSYLENDSFIKSTLSRKIRQWTGSAFIDNIVFLPNTRFISPSSGGLVTLNSNGKASYSDNNQFGHSNFCFFETSSGLVYYHSTAIDHSQHENFDFYKKDSVYYVHFTGADQEIFQYHVLKIGKNEFLISINNHLLRLKNNILSLVKNYSGNILQLYIDSGIFMISIDYGGVIMYDNPWNLNQKDQLFDGKIVSNIHKDFEDNFWFSVFKEGIYLIPSFRIKVYNKSLQIPNTSIVDFSISGDKIVFSTFDKKIYTGHISDNELKEIKELPIKSNPNNLVTHLLIDSKQTLWLMSRKFIHYNLNGDPISVENNSNTGNCFYEDSEGNIYHATKFSFNVYKDGKAILLNGCLQANNDAPSTLANICFNKTINCFYKDNQDVLWLGTNDGLYSYTDQIFTYHGNESSGFAGRISDISSFNDWLLVSCRDYGLVLRKSPKEINTIHFHDGINANAINDHQVFGDSTIWLATNNGICKIQIYRSQPLAYSIYNFSKWDGILSNDIHTLKAVGKYLWMSSENGFASVDAKTLIKSAITPKISIRQVFANNEPLHDTLLRLKFNQNNIKLVFRAISYRNPGKISYRYRLQGYENKWQYSDINEVAYAALKPGKYTFCVSAQSILGMWNPKPAQTTFIILKPLYQKGWFIALVISSFLFLIYLVFRWRVNRLRAKAEQEQNLLNYHQQSLAKQMNPHFVFNSLNSIHRYILENDVPNSSKYLTKFSRLMRMSLEYSNKKLISIEEEINALNLYLELESMRFKTDFGYQIVYNHVKLDYKIPAFILQPFVENSIWHGLMPIKGPKHLLIQFNEHKNYIECIIEDNGIGIEQAKKIKKPDTQKKSYGISLIKERIHLLKQSGYSQMNLEIIDLSTINKGTGTRVSIHFPIIK